MKRSRERSARHVAMDLLARREHSAAELRSKLAARGYPAADVDAAVDQLAAESLQSDRRFVESFTRARIGRGQGPLRIIADLRTRGVDRGLVDELVEALAPDWPALAREARIRRFGQRRPADRNERARQARFLAGRGFSGAQVRTALEDEEDDH